ncbi:MAG: EAL domain-containing protein [Acidimicrobiia bacterium]
MGVPRDVASPLVEAVMAYARRALGAEGAAAVLAAAGIAPDDDRLGDDQAWFGARELVALADALAAATGDDAVGRRVGEELARLDDDRGRSDFLRVEPTPAAAVALAASESARLLPVRTYAVVEEGDRQVVVESHARDAAAHHRFLCDLSVGYWAGIPALFGTVGVVVQPACAARGDAACRLVVRWGELRSADEQERLRRARRATTLVDRFEELQDLAADLARLDDLDAALRRVVERAGATMLAPRFLVTVREHDEAAPRICADGLPDDAAAAIAEALWDGGDGAGATLDRHGVPVRAEVVSGGRRHGHLVAFLPEGTAVRESDVRLLRAYAGHVAATIDRVLSTARSASEHRMAEALLRLAHELAGARTTARVTDLVAEAVGEVTGCEVSGVWLLSPDASRYELQVVREDAGAEGPRTILVADPAGPRDLAADPKPFVIRPGGAPVVDAVLAGWGVEEAYVAPIVNRGRLFGLLATARRAASDGRDEPSVLATVSALAHHAATAIDNAMLLEQVRHQATHDALTGLANRPAIEEQASIALDTAGRLGRSVAVAFVDLDRFKVVNDTLGHVAGDQLIGLVADRIEGHLRPSDAVARLGGDEFLVLLTDLEGPAQAEEVVTRLLEVLREPFELGGESLFVTASVGIACAPHHGTDYGVLLRRADAAMYVAKGEGRNRIALHRTPVGGPRSRLKLESELHQALARDELRVVYQPQVDLLTDEVVGVEALVRWQHPSLGLVGPTTFLSIAEEPGVIVDIDRWVRRTALTQAAAWAAAGTPVRVAVNVSRRDLSDATLASAVDELLAEIDLPPHLVELEITDRIVMSDEDLPPSLAGLRELGVRLAVDDFGTGSSVLSRLHSCPVDVLKVDRTFVEPLSRPRPDTRLVDGLVSMAHALGMEVVIEGVEDEQQAHAVRLLGAELGQGYFFHRPMPAEELTMLLEVQAATAPAVTFPRLVRRKAKGARR